MRGAIPDLPTTFPKVMLNMALRHTHFYNKTYTRLMVMVISTMNVVINSQRQRGTLIKQKTNLESLCGCKPIVVVGPCKCTVH